MVNLSAIQDASTGSVTLYWLAPMFNRELVTSYDVRFKPVGEAKYVYLEPLGVGARENSADNLYELSITVGRSDGLTPLTRCNFEVRAKIHETAGTWSILIKYVGKLYILPTLFNYNRILLRLYYRVGLSSSWVLHKQTTHLTFSHISVLLSGPRKEVW